MKKEKVSGQNLPLQGAIFNLEFEISYKLQELQYQTERLIAYRKALVEHMNGKVRELNRDNFAVRQHLKYVDLYSDKASFQTLTYSDMETVRKEIAPLLLPDKGDVKAIRFDALMYGLELASLTGNKYGKARSDLLKKVTAVSKVANIPEVSKQADLLHQILHTDYLERAGMDEFEEIRTRLRDLMKYIPEREFIPYETHFEDSILSTDRKEAELDNDDLKEYKAAVEYYIRQHQDNFVIAKLKNNQPLTRKDIDALEQILWIELGTKEQYEAEYGEKPLGEFVRGIVGLDMNAAKEAFSEYLDSTNLDSNQIYFVNQIVEYIVHNGMLKDFTVLQDSPFTDHGSVVEIFDDLSVWMGIRKVIETINANMMAA